MLTQTTGIGWCYPDEPLARSCVMLMLPVLSSIINQPLSATNVSLQSVAPSVGVVHAQAGVFTYRLRRPPRQYQHQTHPDRRRRSRRQDTSRQGLRLCSTMSTPQRCHPTRFWTRARNIHARWIEDTRIYLFSRWVTG